jgi:hypothetical protein
MSTVITEASSDERILIQGAIEYTITSVSLHVLNELTFLVFIQRWTA